MSFLSTLFAPADYVTKAASNYANRVVGAYKASGATGGDKVSAALAAPFEALAPNRTGYGQSLYNQGTLVSGAYTNQPSSSYNQGATTQSSPTGPQVPGLNSTINLGSTGGTAGATFAPVTFQGKTYTDPGSLKAAQLDYFQQQHDTNAKAINDAYNSGLITFDERAKALDQNRQSILDQQGQLAQSRDQGYGAVQASFAQAAPDVVQSSQNDYQNKVTDQYNTGLGQTNQALGNIGQAGDAANAGTAYGDLAGNRSAFDTSYQNQLTANDQNLVNQQDTTANNYTDALNASRGTAATPQNIDTQQLLSGLVGTVKNLTDAGQNDFGAISGSLRNGLIAGGVPQNQADPILAYFYSSPYFAPYKKALGQ